MQDSTLIFFGGVVLFIVMPIFYILIVKRQIKYGFVGWLGKSHIIQKESPISFVLYVIFIKFILFFTWFLSLFIIIDYLFFGLSHI